MNPLDPTLISTDTKGTILTCSATSTGGIATKSVMVKRDATRPTVTCLTPAPSFVYGQGGARVSARVTDATSGSIGLISATAPTSSVGSTLSVSLTGSDFAGNSTTTTCPYSVRQAATTTQVASSLNPAMLGQAVTFTATVGVQSPGAGSPGGTVTFLDGAASLGAGTVSTANGVSTATLTTSSLALGPHTITAAYGGSTTFTGSTSASLTQNVDTNLSSFPKLSTGAYNLSKANLRGAYLGGANLARASLTNASFSGANLSGANLSGANLSRANLSNANLRGANLCTTNLSHTNLTGATGLNTAILTGVLWNQTTCPDSTNSNTHGGTCIGHL